MISKCPECGASYPSHHGSICKRCVSKKNAGPELDSVSSKPTSTTTESVVNPSVLSTSSKLKEPVKIEKKEEVIEEERDFFEKPVVNLNRNNNGFKELDMTLMATSAQAMRPANAEKDKPEGVLEICPKCTFINENFDLFCTQCGAMLYSSVATKMTQYQLAELKATFPDQLAKLKKIGIISNMQLLDKGYSPGKRKILSIKTGISEVLLNRLVNQADLVRIDSLEPNDAYLLENIGCNTMKILERKTAADIFNAINKQKSALYSKQIMIFPEEKKVKKWVEEIKTIQKIVT